ncbi:MAG: hypothetical protein ACOYLS_12190 [Polymorphobacter sp.]
MAQPWKLAGLATALLLAAAAAGQPAASPPAAVPPASACAALPETGKVAAPGPDVVVPARPTPDRKLACPDDFRLDLAARLPRCVRPGIRVVDGNPRAACHAAMPVGPIAAIADRHRPTRSCPVPRIDSIVHIDGANVGWSDAVVSVSPPEGVTLVTLSASDAAEAENPVLQRCFAFACRLVKLTVTAAAAPQLRLRIAVPGQAAEATIVLRATCPQ